MRKEAGAEMKWREGRGTKTKQAGEGELSLHTLCWVGLGGGREQTPDLTHACLPWRTLENGIID